MNLTPTIQPGSRVFTLEQAKEMLPIVRRITRRANEEFQKHASQLSVLKDGERRKICEERANEAFRQWVEKVQKLGGEAKGLWLVDFDSGEGYYCWKWPEPDILHYHGYDSGFDGRQKLE